MLPVASDEGLVSKIHDLYVPPEVVRMILISAATTCTGKELLALRLVNRLFDDEILHALSFTESKPTYSSGNPLIQGNAWATAPPGIRQRFFAHLIFAYPTRLNVFAHFAAPVFERELSRLGIDQFDRTSRATRIRSWCRIFTPELYCLPWIIGHRKGKKNFKRRVERFERHCEFLTEHSGFLHGRVRGESRVLQNHQFLRIAITIIEDEQAQPLPFFPESCVCPDEVSPLFGTTILGVAVKWGSLSALQRVLDVVPTTPQKHLDIYLHLASKREGDAETVVKTLLSHFSHTAWTREDFAKRQLLRTIQAPARSRHYSGLPCLDRLNAGNQILLHGTLKWIAADPTFPSKLPILEWLFHRLNGSNYPASSPPSLYNPSILQTPVSSPLPPPTPLPFTYGTHHTHALLLKTATKDHTGIRWTCPCHRSPSPPPLLPHTPIQCPCFATSYRIKCPCYSLLTHIWNRHSPPAPYDALTTAAAHGWLYWVDWLLWAGADPRNCPRKLSLWDFARRSGTCDRVVGLVARYGWDVRGLTFKRVQEVPKRGEVGWFERGGEGGCVNSGEEVWAKGGAERWGFMFGESSGFGDVVDWWWLDGRYKV